MQPVARQAAVETVIGRVYPTSSAEERTALYDQLDETGWLRVWPLPQETADGIRAPYRHYVLGTRKADPVREVVAARLRQEYEAPDQPSVRELMIRHDLCHMTVRSLLKMSHTVMRPRGGHRPRPASSGTTDVR